MKRPRARTIVRVALSTCGLGVVFAAALVPAITLHASTPAFRRTAAAIGNEVMAKIFEGKLVVTDVQSLSIGATGGLHARAVEITDPNGKRVIYAKDVDASIDLVRLVRSIAKTGTPDVEIDHASIGDAEVVLDRDETGTPTIARAFKKRAPAAPPGPAPTGPATADVAAKPVVHVAKASIAHAHVHGNLVPPELDGDGDHLRARFDLVEDVAHVTLLEGKITFRSPKAPNQKEPIIGTASGDLAIALADTRLVGKADLVGACGAIPVVAHAQIDGDDVAASVDIAKNDAYKDVIAGLPFSKPVEIHATAKGKLPSLTVDAHVLLDTSEVKANGDIDVREGHAFRLDVDASHVDAKAYGAPITTDITGKIHTEGTITTAGPIGTFRVVTTEGTAADQKVPPAAIEGRYETKEVTATIRASEPGIDATGKVVLDIPTKVATFDLQARSSSLRTFARTKNAIGGAASVRVQGKVDLALGTIQATTIASGDGIATGPLTARKFQASGNVSGELASPVLDVAFTGQDVALQTEGKRPLVFPEAKGRARIALAPSVRIIDASINVTTHGEDGISASAQGITVANGVVEAHGLTVNGLGEPLELDASVGKGTWKFRAKSAGVDLHKLAAVSGIHQLRTFPPGSKASLDVDVGEGQDGHIDLVVETPPGTFGAGSLGGEVHAVINRGKLVGRAKVAADGFGQIEITHAELDVPDRLDARSLERVTGALEIRGAIDLSQGAALFAGDKIERMAGLAYIEARIERGDPDSMPMVRATVHTDGLEVAYSPDPAAQTIEVKGIELRTHVDWDGRTNDAEASVLSWDRNGPLGSVSAKAKLPLVAWITEKEKLDRETIGKLDVDVVADLPDRDLSKLPPVLDVLGLRGVVAGQLRVHGLVEKPVVVVSGRATGIREQQKRQASGVSLPPLDGTLEGHWDGESAAVTFALEEKPRSRGLRSSGPYDAALPQATRRPKKDPGHLRGLVLLSDVRMSDILRGRPLAKIPWKASSEVEVDGLSLASLGLGGPRARIAGTLSGRASIRDVNRDPSFEARAHVDGFGVGGANVESLDITAGGRNASLFAQAAMKDQSTNATVQIASQSLAIQGLDVSWDAKKPTRLDYAVINGRLALLAPALRSVVSEIDGRVDGTGSITLDANGQTFEGGLALHDTAMYVNTLGEEITSLGATARFEKNGTWRIDDAGGKVGGGEFKASASGKMDGFSFASAEATLVAAKDGIPISSEGATFAEATGEVKLIAKLSDDKKTMVVTVDIPRADVQLPDRSAQQLEPLALDPTILVGVRRKNGKLDASVIRKNRGGKQESTTAPLVTHLTVTLGNEVRLEGRGLDVMLGGKTAIDIGKELAITGRIDLKGGSVVVHGRRFTIDNGVVTFEEGAEIANPTVVTAAYWDAPDRTRVWVEFVGPLKTGKLTLRSEPPYSKNEILSVLLFGRPDPNQAAGAGATGGGDNSGATAVGTGFVASDLNRMLSELDENLDIETDTLSGNRTRTKLGRSFFDRRLKVQVGYAPGHTYREPDTTYLFLNWQFMPKWSLVGTEGDKGTSILDVLFQHRY